MSTMKVDIKAGMNRFQWPMTGIPAANANAAGGSVDAVAAAQRRRRWR